MAAAAAVCSGQKSTPRSAPGMESWTCRVHLAFFFMPLFTAAQMPAQHARQIHSALLGEGGGGEGGGEGEGGGGKGEGGGGEGEGGGGEGEGGGGEGEGGGGEGGPEASSPEPDPSSPEPEPRSPEPEPSSPDPTPEPSSSASRSLEPTLPVGALWLGAAARVAAAWAAAAWAGDAMILPVTPNWMLWPTPGGKRLAPSVTVSPFWFMWVFGFTATFAKSA